LYISAAPKEGRMRNLGMIFLVLSLAGCGIAAKIESRNEYQGSTEKYKQCLEANPSAPMQCEGLRLAMEADERKYNNLSAGIHPGAQSSSNVTILNR
jgi:hypothetical protein